MEIREKIIVAITQVIIESDFTSVEHKFANQGELMEEIKKYLTTFKDLRDKDRIEDTGERNIDYWGKRPFKEFTKFVDNLVDTSSKTSIKKFPHKKQNVSGAEFITENEDWLVYKIKEYKASVLLGSRNWCIVRKEEDFDGYMEYMTLYYILSKKRAKDDRWYKIVLGVGFEDKKSYWDNFDKPNNGAPSVPSELNIPSFNAIYEFRVKINGKYYSEKEFKMANGLNVEGNLNLRNTPVKELPNGLYVEGYLDIKGTKISSLPNNLDVGGDLILGSNITKLPDDLVVDMYIKVDDPSKIKCSEELKKKLRKG